MPLFSGNLKVELAEANSKIADLEAELKKTKDENQKLKSENMSLKEKDYSNLEEQKKFQEQLSELIAKQQNITNEIESKNKEIEQLDLEIASKKEKYIELDDEVLLQEFNLYKPHYKFANSALYKGKLKEIRNKQKDLIKNEEAVISLRQWSVEGSLVKGKKFVKDNIMQMLKSFNIECEITISKVKFNNFESSQRKIEKAFYTLNKLNESNKIVIQDEYLNLKIEELRLAYEYAQKVQEEKEELRIQRELHREELLLAKELEEKRAEIEKEQQHYNNVLKNINDQIDVEKDSERLILLLQKKQDIENNLVELDEALKDVDYREANQRAGYVYIISNIGAFGENVYKIGMTRRLDPQDRVDELGGASVPFKFDVHAFIFSDDAPKLESALHKAFENKKVNLMNTRKEFFNVTLKEIEDVVKQNHDKTVDFSYTAEAQQYRESLLKRKEFQN